MSEIRAVLLIPEAGDPYICAECSEWTPAGHPEAHDHREGCSEPDYRDPHGLLREGPCGARPPIALRGRWEWFAAAGQVPDSAPQRRALVLAWDGEPVAEGLDRLCRRMEWDVYPRGWASIPAVLSWLDGDAPGTLVLLDADGREVTGGA